MQAIRTPRRCLTLLGALLSLTAQAQTTDSLDMIRKLQNLQLDQLGNPQIKSDAIPPVLSTPDAPHRMLIIPVQYANRGFDRFAGEAEAAERNRAYLQQLLFAPDLSSPAEKTLTHYFHHQSKGRYYVTGEVLPIVTVDQPSDYYGKPIQNSDGAWRNDAQAELLVEDALQLAYAQNPDFPWEDFDVWDPLDYDGDQVHAEADGYIDHFVLVFAGKSQSSCQGLFNLDQKFTNDAPADLFDSLAAVEQECAQRIWPHRFSLTRNNGKGPAVEGKVNRRGGMPLKEGLWVYDYNMQSEYTTVSTFIHEFGHSIGLPDIYASQTSNSTASWDAMSSTASPAPQELSSWSRMVLGWNEPCIITPTVAGGAAEQSVYLKTMNDWNAGGPAAAGAAAGIEATGAAAVLARNVDAGSAAAASAPSASGTAPLCDTALVILPPKIRELRMGPLGAAQGLQSAYTGQGNDLNHYLTRRVDLRNVAASTPIMLELDAWFRIEADWDYLYVEASTDDENWQRLLATDKDSATDTTSVMPSRRGHDGNGTLPGFTGRSGDLDGDGRVELTAGCNPNEARELAEDRIGATARNPCEVSQWVHAAFDLAEFRDQQVAIRFHYYADMAAVEDGALIDNVEIAAAGLRDDFEADTFQGWQADGFSLSSGTHDIAVPHFYLLEYRDPYETFATAYNYDKSIDGPGFTFFTNEETGVMEALDYRYRSGVLLWYYNGSYLWSQNEPAQFGPGNGFLLLVDANPQEFTLPAVPRSFLQDDKGWRYYEFGADAQAMLQNRFLDVMCFQRGADYFPVDLSAAERARCDPTVAPAGESLRYNNRQLIYSYTLSNEFLPGADRENYKSMGSLFDYRINRDGSIDYRLYDRLLRNNHSADAPFAVDEFPVGVQYYGIDNNEMVPVRSEPYVTIGRFSDSDPARYLNPHLPFGSAAIPREGLNFELAAPAASAPAGARVKVNFSWD